MALTNESEFKRHFLVVENDLNDATLIRRAFSRVGNFATSFVCRNPSEAKAYLRGAGMYADRLIYPLPNVIISDLRMNGETGFDLLEWIHTQESFRTIPIVILSGSGSPEEMERAKALGADGVYSKPNRLEDLEALVQKLAGEPARAES